MGRKSRVAAFLAVSSMIGFLAIFGFLAVYGVPKDNKDLVNMCLIALIGFVGTAFGYYLGASDNQKNQEATPPSAIPLDLIDNEKGWASGVLLPWLVTLTLLSSVLFGCVGTVPNSTLGNGKVDEVEAATIQVAVGLAMTAAPETVAPAYAVSTSLLELMDGGQLVALTDLDGAIAERIGNLELTTAERQSAIDLAGLIRAKLKVELDKVGMPADQRMVVVRDVVQIDHDSAAARLKPSSFNRQKFEQKLRQRLAMNRVMFEQEYGLR